MTNKDKALALIHTFATGDTEAGFCTPASHAHGLRSSCADPSEPTAAVKICNIAANIPSAAISTYPGDTKAASTP